MPEKIGETTYYTLDEISAKLKVTPRTLRSYIRDGILIAQKVGGSWYITAKALDDFLNARHGTVAGTRGKKKTKRTESKISNTRANKGQKPKT